MTVRKCLERDTLSALSMKQARLSMGTRLSVSLPWSMATEQRCMQTCRSFLCYFQNELAHALLRKMEKAFTTLVPEVRERLF